MTKKNNKKRFEVHEDETIDQCLERINKEGYTPIRRAEEPIFREVVQNGEKTVEPVGRVIVFQAVKQ
ncbi:NETI motif-containing protein [Halobacillus amylolyticus]|uniref:NETI motif-containing protein n=1 Tax=Halobacillus amylolyticus TaxID=2932259 RepID=A0ABY4H5S1_9BACI|nr:NETI motif-containing protein [Halobacillus amylolyticus]UOR10209.1 NETI motif-containing protein [Halobacillus amylolyticus]